MDETLILGILDYLLARGDRSMSSLLPQETRWQAYAREHDLLGWDNFLEGRMTKSLLRLQKDFLYRSGSTMSIRAWATTFIHLLIGIMHQQWVYRNASVHIKLVEGRTQEEHRQVMDEVRKLLDVDPEELLPCHRDMLQEDFHHLGEGSTTAWLLWLDNIESALAERRATLISERTPQHNGLAPTHQPNLSKSDHGTTSPHL
jgi:hypothetical protein